MTTPKPVTALEVRLHGIPVGVLWQQDGATWFRYDEAWLGTGALPLSCSLPLREAPFRESECRPFFANLLPDGDARAALARALGRSASNELSLLAEVGGDCGGAVSLWPPGVAGTPGAAGPAEPLDETRWADLLEELDRRPMLAGSGVRMSLAGAQPKLPIVRIGNESWLPGEDRPSTHLLKPEPRRFPGLAEVEHACMQLAASAGLQVPATRLLTLGGRPTLEIERYDRATEGGRTRRIHQEDACQAHAVLPERKYEEEGGPGFAAVVDLVRRTSVQPAADVLRLVQWLAFNVVAGNADGHAKNVSLLLEPAPRLAPFYDLVATIAFPGIGRHLAMAVGGERLWDRIGAPRWRRLARECGVAERLVLREVARICDDVASGLGRIDLSSPRVQELATEIRTRCERVSERALRD